MEKYTIAIFCHEPHIQKILEKNLYLHFELILIKSLNELKVNENLFKIKCIIAHPFEEGECRLDEFHDTEAGWNSIPLLLIDDNRQFRTINGCARRLAEKIIDLADITRHIGDIQMAIQKYDFKKQIILPETELSQYPKRVQKALRYIHANFDKIMCAKEVSDYLKISTKTFLNEFNKYHTPTFKQYLLDLKFKYAAHLNEVLCLPVKQIAKACGFESENEFHRMWKIWYGISFLNFRNIDKD